MFGRGFCGERCEYKFVHEYGRFLVEPGGLERIEGSKLKSMFVPKLTREGVRALDNRHFVASQLMHYGIEVDEKDFKGRGTALLKKALLAGQCDQVPDHVVQVKEQMHMDWLKMRSIDELISDPEWIMDKHFLRGGLPDRTKTTTVVGVPLPRSSQYRSQCVIEAASKVPGLKYKRALGPDTQMIYIGWDAAAVDKAAKGHAAKDKKAKQAKAKEREKAQEKAQQARDKLHRDYLKTLTRPKGKAKATKKVSPVGSYIVDNEAFEDYYGRGRTDELSLDIHKTDTPGVFQAEFDFGILEGVMILCADEDTLNEYCMDSDEDDEESEVSDSDEEGYAVGSKRKATKPKAPKKKNSKKPKAGKKGSRKYLLKLKCRETGEGEIHYEAEDGSIEFDDNNLASFEADADFPIVGSGISFTAHKISDKPSPSERDWADYSERQHEIERVGRWH